MVKTQSACFLLRGAFWVSYISELWAFSCSLAIFPFFSLLISLLLFHFILFFSHKFQNAPKVMFNTERVCVCACANVNGMGESSANYLSVFFLLAFLYGKSCICAAVFFSPCVRHYLYFLILPCTIFLKTLLSLFKM